MSKYRPCKPHAGHLYFGDIDGTPAARLVNNVEASPFLFGSHASLFCSKALHIKVRLSNKSSSAAAASYSYFPISQEGNFSQQLSNRGPWRLAIKFFSD